MKQNEDDIVAGLIVMVILGTILGVMLGLSV
jgi:hypothetical protein